MQLTCLRHGTTPSNLEGRFNGTSQESLTAEQIEALRNVEFDTSPFDSVYCSDRRRCLETAQALGITNAITEPRLAEPDLGIFEGRTAHECRRLFPDDFVAFQKFDADTPIPGGESRSQNFERIRTWIQSVAGFDHVLAITHGGTVDFLYRLGTGKPLHGGATIYAGNNACVSRFVVNWPDVRLTDYSVDLY